MKKTDEYPTKVREWTEKHWDYLTRHANFDAVPAFALRELKRGATLRQMHKRTARHMLAIVAKQPTYNCLDAAKRAIEEIGGEYRIGIGLTTIYVETALLDIIRGKVESWRVTLHTT